MRIIELYISFHDFPLVNLQLTAIHIIVFGAFPNVHSKHAHAGQEQILVRQPYVNEDFGHDARKSKLLVVRLSKFNPSKRFRD